MTPWERLRELLGYRELLTNLTVRDLRLKYRGSALGVLWSLLNPLIMMAIYTVIFGLFLRVVSLPKYWALVLGGVVAWTFLLNAVTSASQAFTKNSNLINKVYFPIESLPLSNVLAHFVNFAISLVILLIVLQLGGLPLGPSLILLPVIVAAQLALAMGLGLALASLGVYFRDLEHIIPLILAALFYVTPVLYPLDPRALPAGAERFIPYARLNPLSWYLQSYHSVLYYGTWPDVWLFSLMLASAVIALGGGYLLFARLRPRIPEEV
jgi:ABC-type polysaccharide/polyol phosphate export permease